MHCCRTQFAHGTKQRQPSRIGPMVMVAWRGQRNLRAPSKEARSSVTRKVPSRFKCVSPNNRKPDSASEGRRDRPIAKSRTYRPDPRRLEGVSKEAKSMTRVFMLTPALDRSTIAFQIEVTVVALSPSMPGVFFTFAGGETFLLAFLFFFEAVAHPLSFLLVGSLRKGPLRPGRHVELVPFHRAFPPRSDSGCSVWAYPISFALW